MWVWENIQRIIRAPHCANLMHSDLECCRPCVAWTAVAHRPKRAADKHGMHGPEDARRWTAYWSAPWTRAAPPDAARSAARGALAPGKRCGSRGERRRRTDGDTNQSLH